MIPSQPSRSNDSAGRADAEATAIATLPGVIAVHRNTTHWYNNASFALPLLATLVVGVVGLLLRRGDVLAFAAFLLAVTLCMLPVVLVSWRQTPTAVVLTTEGIVSLHGGRTLKRLAWPDVCSVTRRETQGNVRWHVATASGERIALDGELADLDGLLREARRLAGLAEPG
jgi:hypothetical protein